MKVTPLSDDPPRWTSDARGELPEGRAGERLRAAKALDPRAISAAFERRRAVPKRAPWRRRSLAWAAALLLFGMTLTAGAMTAGWWPVRRPSSLRVPDHELEVPAGSALRVGRRGRWRGTLVGPGAASIGAEDADVIRLSSGSLVLAAEAAPVAVWAGPRRVYLAAGASARVEMGEAQEPRVQSLGGQVSDGAHALPLAPTPPVERRIEPAPPAPVPAAVVVSAPTPRRPPRHLVVEPLEELPVPVFEAPGAPAPATEPSTFAPSPSVAVEADGSPGAAAETAALAAAVTALRRQADPRGALRLLDHAEARFPGGDLGIERAMLRAEALLALGDKKQALRVLDVLPTGAAAFNRRLRVARGELRADQDRCAEAMADFQDVLSPALHDDEDERALRGRAVCLRKLDGTP